MTASPNLSSQSSKPKQSWWERFQLWIANSLPVTRKKLADYRTLETALEDVIKQAEDAEAEVKSLGKKLKRFKDQESAHKKQMKDLRDELVRLIDGTHPSPQIKWIEMGMKRAILRDTFGNGGPATIYTASRMAERIREGSMELNYLPAHERPQVKDLLTSEFGKSLLEEAAAEYLRQCANQIQVDKMMSYSDRTTTYHISPRGRIHVNLALTPELFDAWP